VVTEKVHVMEDEIYPRGPMDMSLLVIYEDYVAKQLWNGVVSNNVDIYALKLMCYLLYPNSQIIFIGYWRIIVS